MPTNVEFFFEFASTYSYPAAMRIDAVAAASGVTVRWRPFLLGPIFKAQGWETSPFNLYPDKGRYMWRDIARVCTALDLPFRRPDAFPQNGLMAARVALAGLGESWGKDFVRAVYGAQFVEGRSIADQGVIADLLARLGVTPEPVFAQAHSDAVKARLRAETEEAQRLGIFGAPSFVVGRELFWGNDRLEQAVAWARQSHAA
jgi:2-hydroxychromene-2-carboxylate isomerase